MSRLITFGCSNTYGQGLVDREKNVWGACVSRALNRQHVNMGVPGSSNKYIAYNITKFEFLKEDLVLILWTFPERYTKIISEEDKYNFLPNFNDGQNDELNEVYYSYIFSYPDSDFDNRCYMNFSLYHLQNSGIKFYNLFIRSEFIKFIDNKENIIPHDFKTFYHKYPKGTDDLHLGDEGHIEFSKAIVDYLS